MRARKISLHYGSLFPYAKVHLSFPFCFVMPFMIMAVFYEKK